MKIGLFIPCYVDALYPEVGVATYKLLKHLGLDVDYPEGQTRTDVLWTADGEWRFREDGCTIG